MVGAKRSVSGPSILRPERADRRTAPVRQQRCGHLRRWHDGAKARRYHRLGDQVFYELRTIPWQPPIGHRSDAEILAVEVLWEMRSLIRWPNRSIRPNADSSASPLGRSQSDRRDRE